MTAEKAPRSRKVSLLLGAGTALGLLIALGGQQTAKYTSSNAFCTQACHVHQESFERWIKWLIGLMFLALVGCAWWVASPLQTAHAAITQAAIPAGGTFSVLMYAVYTEVSRRRRSQQCEERQNAPQSHGRPHRQHYALTYPPHELRSRLAPNYLSSGSKHPSDLKLQVNVFFHTYYT